MQVVSKLHHTPGSQAAQAPRSRSSSYTSRIRPQLRQLHPVGRDLLQAARRRRSWRCSHSGTPAASLSPELG